MASLAVQQQAPQQQNMNPVVEVFCEPGVLLALGWGDGAAISPIRKQHSCYLG